MATWMNDKGQEVYIARERVGFVQARDTGTLDVFITFMGHLIVKAPLSTFTKWLETGEVPELSDEDELPPEIA